MEDEIQKIMVLVGGLNDLSTTYRNLLAETPVTVEIRNAFENLEKHLREAYDALNSGSFDSVLQCARNAAIYGQVIGQHSAKLNDASFKNAGGALLQKANELRTLAEESPLALKPLVQPTTISSEPETREQPVNYAQIRSLMGEHLAHDERVKKLLNENELRIAGLEQKLKGLEDAAQSEIDKISTAYSDGLREIGVKKTEINDILGHVSGRAIAGDYEKSAAEEKKMADRLRLGSLVCMAVIAGCLIYTLVGHSADWQQSLFRISLTFLLSVPAAYLARESAKHREQQYQHLQTSLDLKALSPFVASLPDEEQHKIKIAIASKIFAGRDFSKVGADPFPINTQEIIMELLKKVDVSKAKPQKASE